MGLGEGRVCAGMREYARVCAGMRGYARVCAGNAALHGGLRRGPYFLPDHSLHDMGRFKVDVSKRPPRRTSLTTHKGLRAAELKGWLRVQLKGVWGFSRISCVSTQLAASVWPKAKGRHKRLHT